MATERLYYASAYTKNFSARVTGCREDKRGHWVTLDRTAFYPEGGGQPWDTGRLGGTEVLEVHERDGEVEHLCAKPLEPGAQVNGAIDWQRRFDLMQQHSGEHIVSGLICQRFRCNNVGFHIGGDTVTIDFDCAMTDEQAAEIERRANEYIWEDHPSDVCCPVPAELEALDYRSKKALTGEVRIVRFPGADCCACCGTHLSRSGEVGLVKFLSRHKFREGVRIEMLCGGRALAYFTRLLEQNGEISALLSAKPLATAAAVRRLSEEAQAAKYRLVGLESAAFRRVAAAMEGAGDCLLFAPGLDADAVRRLCDGVLAVCGGLCAVFSGAGESYKYALGRRDGEVSDMVKAMNAALNGRGGGKAGFAQGSVQAERAEIERFFASLGVAGREVEA